MRWSIFDSRRALCALSSAVVTATRSPIGHADVVGDLISVGFDTILPF